MLANLNTSLLHHVYPHQYSKFNQFGSSAPDTTDEESTGGSPYGISQSVSYKEGKTGKTSFVETNFIRKSLEILIPIEYQMQETDLFP